jgi:hypothetical protein
MIFQFTDVVLELREDIQEQRRAQRPAAIRVDLTDGQTDRLPLVADCQRARAGRQETT